MITVIFSTCNGGTDLRKMLDGLTLVDTPSGGWELLAVDNGSSDDSPHLMRAYESRLPIVVLNEPTPGKNRALNRALARAKGDFLVFTDDDIIVQKDWLVQWRKVADAQPDYSLFAGCTRPLWPYEPPPWLLRGVNVSVLYAAHEGIQEGPCSAACMYGTNMAMRATVFRNDVGFCTSIGPDGSTNYAMGSDTEIALRLEKEGHKCWFASAPFVEHIVPAAHLEPSWILWRGYRWGRGLARMGISYPCTADELKRKNTVKRFIYPTVLPLIPKANRWQRQWQYMVDKGYEDGVRENRGLQPRWK
jgi:glycosyltransferase involved in cell wall biosynthesis